MTLLVACLPVVHAWYWLTPLALGLAAGLWLPVAIGSGRSFPGSARRDAGRLQAPPWRPARRAGGGPALDAPTPTRQWPPSGAVPHTEHR